MTSTSTVGLALIARDEEPTLPTLLASIAGAFDQVVLVDTGSTDRTVEIFEEWCATEGQRNPAFTYRLDTFEWVDDFAAARNHADSLLTTAWRCWADCDDEIRGAEHIRRVCADAPPDAAAVVADYAYAHDQHGNVVCTLRRERLVRSGIGEWTGRVHEAQVFDGPSIRVDPDTLLWIHRKPPEQHEGSSGRNLRILRAWHEEEQDNPRVTAYLGTELQARGEHAAAIGYLRAYLELPSATWAEERAQVCRKLAASLLMQGDGDAALQAALDGLLTHPQWSDSYLSLAQASLLQGRPSHAIHWASEVLRLGMPDSLLILNPLDYAVEPRWIMCSAYAALGDWERAAEHGRQALAVVPHHEGLRAAVADAAGRAKREATAQTFAGAARLLAEHDEPLRGLEMLERCVPHFATDHPVVVAERSRLRERVAPLLDPGRYAAFYSNGGAKPEEEIPDDLVAATAERLPRAVFLRDGLAEQMGEAA